MKSKIITVVVSIFILVGLSLPALAAQPLDLYIDNLQVPTEPGFYYDDKGEKQAAYYMDVQPQLKDGRAFVPVRTVAKYLGVKIDWQGANVLLTYGDTTLKLTPGSQIARKNDKELTLDAVPYIKDGRTMVPLRFVAEALGCKIAYANGKVYVGTQPLFIDGKKVVSVQSRMRMTMGGITDECKNNYFITQFYLILSSSDREETAAPDYYGSQVNLDIPNYYYLSMQYSFMESVGVDGAVIQQYQIYVKMNDWGEDNNLAPVIGTDLGDWLIHDINGDKWHKLDRDDYQKRVNDIPAGDWLEILNDVV